MLTEAQKVVLWIVEMAFLNNPAIAMYFFMEYFLCFGCILIFILHLTQKAHFYNSKLVNISSFYENCSMLLEPVPAHHLPLRNIDLSFIILLNQYENNNINKETRYLIRLCKLHSLSVLLATFK